MNLERLPPYINAHSGQNDRNKDYFHKWSVNNTKIKWFKKNNYDCLMIYVNKIVISLVEFSEEMRNRIKKTNQLEIDREGKFIFAPVIFKQDFEQIELSLLSHGDEKIPTWQLLDRKTKQTQWQKFSSTFVSRSCHRETWDNLEKYKKSDINVIKYFEEDFIIKDIVALNKIDIPEYVMKPEYPMNIDLESKAEEHKEKLCALKEKRAWEKISSIAVVMLEMSTYAPRQLNCAQQESAKIVHVPKNCEFIEERKKDGRLMQLGELKYARRYYYEFIHPNRTFLRGVADKNQSTEITNNTRGDYFVYGGTKQRIIYEECEKTFAIFSTIVENLNSIVLGYQQKSLIEHPFHTNESLLKRFQFTFSHLISVMAPKNFLVAEKIEPLVKTIFPFYVIVEPKTKPCKLDTNVQVSKFVSGK